MQHYTIGIPKKSKSVVSFFERLGGSSFGDFLRRETVNEDDEEEKTPQKKAVIPSFYKGMSCFFAGIGILCLFSAIIMAAKENEAIERIGRLGGCGVFLIFLGPVVLTHIYIWKTTATIPIKVFQLAGLAILYFFLVNGFLFLIFGLQLLCKEFFFAYDPDIGICECDDRPLLTVGEEVLFDPNGFGSTIKVASIGDIKADRVGEEVLRKISEKQPDLLVINGDLTYIADPQALENMLNNFTSDHRIPVFVTVGNHDTGIFTEYQAVVQDKYNRYLQVTREDLVPEDEIFLCNGTIGVDTVCSFHNMGFVFSGLGSTCGNDDDLNVNLKSHLELFKANNIVWRTVFIHKNQRLLQIGGKKDEVGIEAYQNSLAFGAVVMNSHEHSYARSKTLTSVGLEEEDFTFVEGNDQLSLRDGNFVVVANGLGGKSIRDVEGGLENNDWWAKTFHSASGRIDYGFHLCEYGINLPNVARCTFETINEFVVDSYEIVSLHGQD